MSGTIDRTRSPHIWTETLLLLMFTTLPGSEVQAQPEQGILLQTLNPMDVLYVLSGGGGNSLALDGDDGVVLIDSKDTVWTAELLEAIRGVSDKPVTTIINTHAHTDHVGGNTNITTATRIIAHAHTRAAMERMEIFQGDNARFLPNEPMLDTMSLLDGPDRIDLYHFGPGHTDGDLVVVFPEKGIAYVGDLFQSKSVPVIDRANGGSIRELPHTLARVVTQLEGIRQVVPGHEAPKIGHYRGDKPAVAMPMTVTMSWADLEEYAGFVAEFVTAVETARAAGQTVNETANSLSLPERYQSYDMQHARAAIEALYAEMAGR